MKGERVYKHSAGARTAHWLWTLALLVLVMSGLQIFDAAPYLDLSDASDPARRILAFDAVTPAIGAAPVGRTIVFGHPFVTTGLFGWTDDGLGGHAMRAFPAWMTLPGPQDLADGRLWHFFFGWMLVLALALYLASGTRRRKLRDVLLRRADLPKLAPMTAYYLRRRREPPEHGAYNPLQKAAYTLILLVVFPVVVLTGFALSPGVDSALPWLTVVFGGRQFARTWHFVSMAILIGFTAGHVLLVAVTGLRNNLRSMITGWYVLDEHGGVGP